MSRRDELYVGSPVNGRAAPAFVRTTQIISFHMKHQLIDRLRELVYLGDSVAMTSTSPSPVTSTGLSLIFCLPVQLSKIQQALSGHNIDRQGFQCTATAIRSRG
ncbi:unnamed protein product [Cercospora beticola]|nr:unnamed protein product [Cercospora beticola]